MSSHREAPAIAQDPVADNTDLYAFVSPDRPDTVTILANYIPLEEPAGGPNFNQFGDDVIPLRPILVAFLVSRDFQREIPVRDCKDGLRGNVVKGFP